MADIATSLAAYGADPAALHLFDRDAPELLPYATLLTARGKRNNSGLAAVEAVYEWQGAPLLFLVNADLLDGESQLHQIRRLLAMRGDAPYLGVLSLGRLEVYRLALDKKSPQQAKVALNDGEPATLLPRLGNARPGVSNSQRCWISKIILNLLTESISELRKSGCTGEDAISLAGRALFTRFLADRELLPHDMCSEQVFAHLFDHAAVAKNTSSWLDQTFNGDLLPLSENTFENIPDSAYAVLGNILRRAPAGQLFLGWEAQWDNLDFSHIPVGVLSQVYEWYLRRHESKRQKKESVFYTPRPIVDLMVRASFRALEHSSAVCAVKVLDPAAGAGVFLLSAFRELVAARWRVDGKQPDTELLRSILYQQIRGFDIDETALRFSALGLYLLSIELDPNPKPVDKLRFKNLRGTVLHRLVTEDKKEGSQLGSLGPLVGLDHVGQYDLVIGNPPWTGATGLRDWNLVRKKVADIAASRQNKRDGKQSPPLLPNEVPDLPFVWRAMEWAKPGGQITFALHARLLFQQWDGMREARQALFEALDVTAVINAAALRGTQVWPSIAAPFCLLFATNGVPTASAGFRFVSPRLESSLNAAGVMRVDALNSAIISSAQISETPDILKILFCGTRADLRIIERIRSQEHLTLADYWREKIGMKDKRHLLGSGDGYQPLYKSSEVRPAGDGKKGVDASHLLGLPEVTFDTFTPIIIDTQRLSSFKHRRVHRARSREIFAAPLVIVRQALLAEMGRVGIAISENNVVFGDSFYGYSPITHPDSGEFVRYLTLILGSRLVTWMALVTSGQFGFERNVIEKNTLDNIPIPSFETLTSGQREEATELFERLRTGSATWDEVDAWVAALYRLNAYDLQIIADTLEFNLPFAENQQRAQQPPSIEEKKNFCKVLVDELTPWCQLFGTLFTVMPFPQIAGSPWDGIALQTDDTKASISDSDWAGILHAANETASTEVLIKIDKKKLLLGRLAQRRYWSTTQARLLAQRIIWSHLDVLKG